MKIIPSVPILSGFGFDLNPGSDVLESAVPLSDIISHGTDVQDRDLIPHGSLDYIFYRFWKGNENDKSILLWFWQERLKEGGKLAVACLPEMREHRDEFIEILKGSCDVTIPRTKEIFGYETICEVNLDQYNVVVLEPSWYEVPRCWCSCELRAPFYKGYKRCIACSTLIFTPRPNLKRYRRGESENDLYGSSYWYGYMKEKGYPNLEERADHDLDERCAYWRKNILRYLKAPSKFLEVGCAHGGLLYLLEQDGFTTTGLELSPSVADFGRKKFGVDVRVGKFEDVYFPKNCFDGVGLFDVLEHLPAPLITLKGIGKVLKPGGYLFLQTCDWRGEGDDWIGLIPGEHLFLFNKQGIRAILALAGLVTVAIEKSVFTYDVFVVAQRPLEGIVASVPDNEFGEHTDLGVNTVLENWERWEMSEELAHVAGGWMYKDEFYPDYLTVGGASFASFPIAKKFCQGKGIDHGAGFWPFQGAIPIDTIGPGRKNTLDDFEDSSLDYVFSSHFLEHIENWQEMIESWWQKLKPNGILFLYLPHPDCKLWQKGSPMIGEGHKWNPEYSIVESAVKEALFEILDGDAEMDGMFSFYIVGEKKVADLQRF